MDGLVRRLVELAPRLFGGATQTVGKAAIVGAAAIIIGLRRWTAVQLGEQAWALRLGVAALITSLLIVSSVTWQHHLVTLLLPVATATAWITVRRPGPRYGWGLAAAYIMCWMDRRAFPLPADLQVHTPGPAAPGAARPPGKHGRPLPFWLARPSNV